MAFRWTRPPSRAWDKNIYKQYLRRQVETALDNYWAPQIETSMKDDAPWTDRTGNARQSLRAFVDSQEDTIRIVAKQEVDYGGILELRNGGQYAVVMPTLRSYFRRVWDHVKQVVG